MTDEGRNPVISMKVAGRMRRLATPKQWRSAIASGEMSRDTQVKLERIAGLQEDLPAGQITELIAVFDELIGPEAVSLPPAPPPPPPPPTPLPPPVESPSPRPTASPWGEAASEPAPAATDTELEAGTDEPLPPETSQQAPRSAAPQTRPQTPTSGTSVKGPLLIVGGLVGLLVVGFALSDSARESTSGQGTASSAKAEKQFNQQFYASRDAQVRAARSDSALATGSISRGQLVQTDAPVSGWVALSTGGFVRSDVLQTEAPPLLDRSTAENYYTVERAKVLKVPDQEAPSLGEVAAMEPMKVFGTVNGVYAEVETETGQIGYVDWSSLGGVGGKGRRAWLKIRNRCPTTKNIAFSLVIDGKRSAINGYWTFNPGHDNAISLDDTLDQRIVVDSAFNYYADLGDTFNLGENTSVSQVGDKEVRVNGRLVQMKRLVPELTPEGAYSVTFC